jgi:hypothetical protein
LSLKCEGLNIFWDKECLEDGAPWEECFKEGLKKSRKVITLISEKALGGFCDKALTGQDNVLMEWELAVDKLEAGESEYIVPVLVGEYISLADGSKALKKFGAFCGVAGKPWPDKLSTTCKTRTIKQTMQKLFQIQGIHLDPERISTASKDIQAALVRPPQKQLGSKPLVARDPAAGPVQGQPQGQGHVQGTGATTVHPGKANPYVFLSHAWGKDQMGRDNHARVAKINDRLKYQNIDTWFDSQGDMKDDTVLAMTNGIDACDLVIVFVTRAYIDKCKKKGNDNCKLELNYAYTHKTVERLVSVVMEPGCGAPASWDGPVSAYVGTHLYIGCMGDDDSDFDNATLELAKKIHEKFDERIPPSSRAQPRASAVANTATVSSAVSSGVKILICCCNPDGLLEAANEEVEKPTKICPNHKLLKNASVGDFEEAMHDFKPKCVVFIGHGGVKLRGNLTLGFVGNNGDIEVVEPDDIAQMLQSHKNTLQVVFLNGCTTIDLAKCLYDQVGIPHVVGWSSKVVDEAAQIFSCKFFSRLNDDCTNAKQAFDDARVAVTRVPEPDGSGINKPKYELEDPMNRAVVDQGVRPYRSRRTGRIAAGQPIHLSHEDSVQDWLLLARSMQEMSSKLVTFIEPVDQKELHICEHCAPLHAVEGTEYQTLMADKSNMDAIEDVMMQKRRYNLGAFYEESVSDKKNAGDTKNSFDADNALLLLNVSLAAVLGPAACGKTTTMHKLAFRRLQKALKNPTECIPILVPVYRLAGMLKKMAEGGGSDGRSSKFDPSTCDMLVEFVGDRSFGMGICRHARTEEFDAYVRLIKGKSGTNAPLLPVPSYLSPPPPPHTHSLHPRPYRRARSGTMLHL